jgi:hypothetical protein
MLRCYNSSISLVLIFVNNTDHEHRPNVVRSNVLTFCDLAGSERFDSTPATKQSVVSRQETQNINKSIYALGNCIQALSRFTAKGKRGKNGAYVPYRDSKLTRLLGKGAVH